VIRGKKNLVLPRALLRHHRLLSRAEFLKNGIAAQRIEYWIEAYRIVWPYD
jgi:hypothetical protein